MKRLFQLLREIWDGLFCFPPMEGEMIECDARLAGLRPGMRVQDPSGSTVGFVREVSGRSVLIGEVSGRRVWWLDGERIEGLIDGAVRLRAAHR